METITVDREQCGLDWEWIVANRRERPGFYL